MRRLLHGADRTIFVTVDGHPAHKAQKVQRFLETVAGRLEFFFLPPYSPELNPDEFVWNDLKSNGIGRMVITGPDEMKREVMSHLRWIQKSPDLIRSSDRSSVLPQHAMQPDVLTIVRRLE